VLHLGFSAVQFGFLDGVFQGGAVALVSLISGMLADRWRRQKEVATAGYALSALCRIGLLAAGNVWTVIAGILALDGLGKGIRTAPRDAMISLASPRVTLATAFAVHRALDTCGAVLGPLAAFLMLRSLPGAFNLVLVASFCIALVGLGVISLLVDKPAGTAGRGSETRTLQLSFGLLRQRKFRVLVIAAGGYWYYRSAHNKSQDSAAAPGGAGDRALDRLAGHPAEYWLRLVADAQSTGAGRYADRGR